MAQSDGGAPRSHTKHRRAMASLASLAALACILGALVPAAALTTRNERAFRVASPNTRRQRYRKPVRRPSFAVRVRGNHLVNAHGEVLRLVGVNRSGGQYMC